MKVTPPLFALAIVLTHPQFTAATQPVQVGLVPISDEVLHLCSVPDLEKGLKGGLGGARRFSFVPEMEAAPVKIEILDCSRLEQAKRTLTSKGGPIKIPVETPGGGRGIGVGAESEVSLERQSTRLVVLRARLVAGPRFADVTSGPKDRTLHDAVETLRHEIDKVLKERGEWLLASPP